MLTFMMHFLSIFIYVTSALSIRNVTETASPGASERDSEEGSVNIREKRPASIGKTATQSEVTISGHLVGVFTFTNPADLERSLREKKAGITKNVFMISKGEYCEYSSRWKMLNPDFDVVQFYGDDKIAEFIVQQLKDLNLIDTAKFSDTQFKAFFESHNAVQMSDILRYLLVYLHGGVYADCDLKPVRGIDSWLREYGYESVAAADLDLIVGIEFYNSQTRGSETVPLQFEQYGFMAAPRSPILKIVLQEVVRRLLSQVGPDIRPVDVWWKGDDRVHLMSRETLLNKTELTSRETNLNKTELTSRETNLNKTEDDFIETNFGPIMWTKTLLAAISDYGATRGSGSDGRPLLLPAAAAIEPHGTLLTLSGLEGTNRIAQILALPYRAFSYPGWHASGTASKGNHLAEHQCRGTWRKDGNWWRRKPKLPELLTPSNAGGSGSNAGSRWRDSNSEWSKHWR